MFARVLAVLIIAAFAPGASAGAVCEWTLVPVVIDRIENIPGMGDLVLPADPTDCQCIPACCSSPSSLDGQQRCFTSAGVEVDTERPRPWLTIPGESPRGGPKPHCPC